MADDETTDVFKDEGSEEATTEGSTTEQLLKQLLEAQAAHRKEVAEMREELRAAKQPVQQRLDVVKTAEELFEERMAAIRQHSHYCPGCGRLSHYMRECTGRGEAPHQPIDMVSTEELTGDDPNQHTPAPATTNLG